MNIAEIIQQLAVPMIAMVCYCICFAVKKAGFLKDKYIPLLALALGAISGLLMNGLSYEAVAQGIASGALAVAIHETIKQFKKDDSYTI